MGLAGWQMGTFIILLVVYWVVILSMLVYFQGNVSENGPIHEEKQALSCIWLFLHGQ